MPSEHLIYQRFNTSILSDGAFTPVWQSRRASALGADARINRQSRPYWEANLSGSELDEEQKDHLLGLQYRNRGGITPVLMSVPSFCEIGIVIGTDYNDRNIVTPAPLVTGDGDVMEVQIRKRLLVEGYENEFIYHDILFPFVDYPPQYGIGKTINGKTEWQPLDEIKIYEDGDLMTSGYSINRSTGIVTLDSTTNGAHYTIQGGYYILMLLPDKIPMKQIGSCLYRIDSGVVMVEPAGGR